MRTLILAFVSALVLASCQSMYDDAARDECSRLPPSRQMSCNDAVDRNSRAHRD